jgi:nitrate/nitrite transporter NarK
VRGGGRGDCRAAGLLDDADAAAVRHGAGRGIGFVNLFGAIGGFLAPIVRVQAETLFASSAAGLLTLAGVAIVGVVIIFSLSLTRAVPQRGSVQH